MSEETTPPLRLKPRLRTEAGAPASSIPVKDDASGAAAPTPSPVSPAPRAKPRLSLVGDNESSTPAATVSSPLLPEVGLANSPTVIPADSPSLPPVAEEIPATAPLSVEAKPLSENGPVPSLFTDLSPSAPSGLQDSATTLSAPEEPPPPALLIENAGETLPLPPPKVASFATPPKPIHIRLAHEIAQPAEAPAPVAPRPEHRPAFKLGVLAVSVLGLAVLAIAGYFAFRTFQNLKPAEPAVAKTPPPPQPAIEKRPVPASLPLIAAAKTVAIENRGEMTAILDAGAGKATATLPTPSAQDPLSLPKTETTSPVEIMVSPSLAEPSMAFIEFVETMRVNGVFQGIPARAHINGRTVKAGALIETQIGVFFDGVDADRRELIFKDASGASVRKKY
ncbi:MAG TPA: hypothetical protein PLN52_16840 [Opitutaceae bacterium]|nr:hypothetical protein [Opitutaceae bacterium]